MSTPNYSRTQTKNNIRKVSHRIERIEFYYQSVQNFTTFGHVSDKDFFTAQQTPSYLING